MLYILKHAVDKILFGKDVKPQCVMHMIAIAYKTETPLYKKYLQLAESYSEIKGWCRQTIIIKMRVPCLAVPLVSNTFSKTPSSSVIYT